jgi:hypothetical protein
MIHNSDMHSRRQITVNIMEELDRERLMNVGCVTSLEHNLTKPNESTVLPIEVLAICLGIQLRGLGQYSPENN